MAAQDDAPATVLAYHLVAAGVGTGPAGALPWAVYWNKDPQAPDQVLVVKDTGADQDGRDHRTGDYVQHPTVQVTVRAKTQDVAKAKARAVVEVLKGLRNTVVTVGPHTYRVAGFHLTTGVTPIGVEEQGTRELVVFNGRTTLTQLT